MGIAAILLLGIIAFAVTPQPPTATLVVHEGEVTVNRSDLWARLAGNSLQNIQSGQAVTLQAGSTIQLAPNALAQLNLVDGSSVDLSEGANLEIDVLNTTQETYRVKLNLFAGKTVNRVMRLIGAGDYYELITPSSTISVRGTVFAVQVIDPNTTYVATYEGVVHVAMGDQGVDLQAGEELTARSGEPLQALPLEDATPPEPLVAPPTQPAQAPATAAPGEPDASAPEEPDAPAPQITPNSGDAINPDGSPPTGESPATTPESPSTSDSEAPESTEEPESTPNNPDTVPGNPSGEDGSPSGGATPPGQGGDPPGQQDKEPKPTKEQKPIKEQ
jgi:hypothetical protein